MTDAPADMPRMMNRLMAALVGVVLVACSTAPSSSQSPLLTAPTLEGTSPWSRASLTPRESASATAATGATAPTGTPVPFHPVATWRMTASLDSSPRTAYVTDVAAWRGGFVAIGSAWETEYHVTAEMPAMWTSSDGESWAEQPIDLGVGSITLIGVAPRIDGRLLLVANVPGSGAMSEPSSPRSMAWVSDDAARWEATDLPGVGNAPIGSLDHGPRGYVLTAQDNVWFSADGVEWMMSYDGAVDAVAGDEGFVAIRVAPNGSSGSVIASADGMQWHESAPTSATLIDIAGLGGDWVATGYSPDPQTITVWHSANGLDWVQALDVNELTGPEGPKTGRGLNEPAINGASLAGGAGHAFLTLTNNHCCAQMSWNYGAWGSSDGMSWEPVVEGDAFVSSVAANGQTTVAVGHLGRGEVPAFWIGD